MRGASDFISGLSDHQVSPPSFPESLSAPKTLRAKKTMIPSAGTGPCDNPRFWVCLLGVRIIARSILPFRGSLSQCGRILAVPPFAKAIAPRRARRRLLPLLGERVGVRASLSLTSLRSWYGQDAPPTARNHFFVYFIPRSCYGAPHSMKQVPVLLLFFFNFCLVAQASY